MSLRSIRSLSLVVAGAIMALTAIPGDAAADSFFFGVSSGDRHRHYHRHRHYPYHHHRPHNWSGYHHHRYYHRPPIVVVRPAPPPVIYAPPPAVVYSAPPVVSAIPSSPVYQTQNGQYCREYQGTITVNGVSQPSYGTACLMPDGTWRVVN
jgi:hypothetical protein